MKIEVTSEETILIIPSKALKGLINSRIVYQCSGCPEYHIAHGNLPDGVTRKAFVELMKLMFNWRKNKRWPL